MGKKPVGVYVISNPKTDETYIGSGVLHNRERDHFRQLKTGRHGNYKLQKAFNKDPEGFEFHGAELETRNAALEIENALIEEHWGNPLLLNLAKDAKAPMQGRKMSDEVRRRMSESQQGHPGVRHTPETIEKIREAHRGNSYRSGKPHSEETKALLSKMVKERMTDPQHREKISQSLRGRRPTEETREKLREFHTRNAKTESGKLKLDRMREIGTLATSRPVTDGKNVYPSIRAAARANGISLNAAHNRVKSKSVKFEAWQYVETRNHQNDENQS